MVQQRSLPQAHNFMLFPENSPTYQDLVERRRFGRTNLAVKPGQVGTSNATKAKNLGSFDYVHLRAPLPPQLVGSELFSGHPLDSYFLMRRSSDGYVSASGMFKVAFPWAALVDEEGEMKYLKGLPTTSPEETAGNVWIPPTHALELATQYKMGFWIRALLDPAPIEKGAVDTGKKPIASPPPFVLPDDIDLSPPAPLTTPAGRSRGRRRSNSPGRAAAAAASARKIASPRKRTTKTSHAAGAANAAAVSLREDPEEATSGGESKHAGHNDRVHVEVDAAVDTNGDVETEYTKVRVDLSSDLPGPPRASDTAEMIAKARKIAEEAWELDGIASKATKRKADEFDDEDDESDEFALAKPAKKARILQEELKKERVKAKALLGLSATLAIGAIIPYVL